MSYVRVMYYCGESGDPWRRAALWYYCAALVDACFFFGDYVHPNGRPRADLVVGPSGFGLRRTRPDIGTSSAPSAVMALLLLTAASGLLIGTPTTRAHRAPVCSMGLHDLSATGMDGAEVALGSLKGKKVLALNVASK